MLRLICLSAVVAVAVAMSTAPSMMGSTASSTTILYDLHHKKAMIVMADGCYEFHLSHADAQAAADASGKAALEARILEELAKATNKHEAGHHSIDHMSAEIKAACDSLPVYAWEVTGSHGHGHNA